MQQRAKTYVFKTELSFKNGKPFLRCPLSKTVWRLLEVADSFTTADAAISLDYHLALRMIRRPDFVEGVRALLVDKDKAPKWSPNRLELVDNDLLKEVFNEDGLPPLR